MFIMASGCVFDEIEQGIQSPIPEGTKAIELNLSLKNALGGLAATKGIGTEPGDYDDDSYGVDPLNENKIDKIDLFIFDATTKTLIRSFENTKINRLNPNADPTVANSYKVRVLVPMAEVNALEGKSVQIVVIVNSKDNILTGVTDLASLESKFQSNANELDKTTAQTNFLMDGSISTVTINWGANALFTVSESVKLYRALSKVRLRIAKIAVFDYSNGGNTEYEVVPVGNVAGAAPDIGTRLFHYSEEGSVITSSTPHIPTTWKNTEYRATIWASMVGQLNPERPDGKYLMHFPFYAYENNWSDDLNKESYLFTRIRLRPKFKEDGVTPNTDDLGHYYYYRFPVNYRLPMDGVTADKINRLERNHLYDIVSKITELGSIDEGDPIVLSSYVAIQPWITGEEVNAIIDSPQYLVVKDRQPIMANKASHNVDYISSVPVSITINDAYYEYYDMRGDFFKVVYTADGKRIRYDKNGTIVETQTGVTPFDGANVQLTGTYTQDGKLVINHTIPINYAPFYIKFTVSQVGGSLSETVFVTQYPPIYVTGSKSIGMRPTEGDIAAGRPYADFRHHTSFGARSTYQGGTEKEAQRNDVFNRITTKVPSSEFLIGNPVDPVTLRTKNDVTSNNLVSPEFIIASQYGIGMSIPQSSGSNTGAMNTDFASGYGPYARPFYPSATPYRDNSTWNSIYKTYGNAESRCFDYFEGEYGTDGYYTEHYKTSYSGWDNRQVYKTFKYQGRWRIPTMAELQLIDKIQDAPEAMTKSLLYGENYWSAETGRAYNFVTNQERTSSESYVRCIFDTAHLNDK